MSNKKTWRVNKDIRAPKVRVIDSEGSQIDVMDTQKALELAKDEGKDLIEIAPTAKPPVVQIIEFGKFKYQQEKKKKKEKKGSKSGEVKEVRFSPFIGDADFKTREKKVKEFLSEGNKIRAVVKFKGRQMGSKKFGYDVLEKLMDSLEEEVNIDMKPKFVGRHLTMVISPLSKK